VKLLADECVPLQVVQRLRSEGHEVAYILDDDPGITDSEILARAVSQGITLLTEDKDFGDLVFERGQGAAGVVLLRLRSLSPEAKAEAVAAVLRDRASDVVRSFVVVSPGRVRIRPFLPPKEEGE
jgi:predicted nuclease of predicted toxin-antitoxin system